MDDPEMMLIKARHADLMAEAQRWRAVHRGAEQRRAARLLARAERLGAWADRLRRRAVLLDQTCRHPSCGPRLNLVQLPGAGAGALPEQSAPRVQGLV